MLVIIDGLDERGVSQANELITQVQCYAEVHPKCNIVMSSRPLPGLRIVDQRTRISALEYEDAAKLITRIAGRSVHVTELYSWPEAMRNAAREPLFAIMIGCELRKNAVMGVGQPAELISRLAQQVIERNPQDGDKANELLHKLAVNSISTGKRVRKSDVSLSLAEHRLLADSCLVEERADTVDFSHEVLREWYAARALTEETVSIENILPASDRWLTAFSLVIDSENQNAASILQHQLASSDPGLASLLISCVEGQRADKRTIHYSPETARGLGEELWRAMDSWRRGLGKLFQIVGPLGVDGLTATVGIHIDDTWVTTAWYNGPRGLDRVVPLTTSTEKGWTLHWGDWPVLHSEKTPLRRGWPWIATRSHLVDALSRTIETRRLALPSCAAIRELTWAFSLAVKDQGEFSRRPILVREVLKIVQHLIKESPETGTVFEIGRMKVSLEELKLIEGRLAELIAQRENVIGDPWAHFDQIPSNETRGCRTWDFYSDDRLLERTRIVYTAALRLYGDIVERWFGAFRSRLRLGRLFPVTLECQLTRSERPSWEGAPSLRWRVRVLPLGDTSKVTCEWHSAENVDILSYWKEEEESLRVHRPGMDATPHPIVGDALPAIDSIRPATDLAHRWLIEDLSELDWTELSSVSTLG